MKVILLVLCVGCVLGQDQCVTNYAELEDSLLNNPENQYQIAKAFFRPKRRVDPVCVFTYYYVGVNTSNVVRQNCPTEMIADEDGIITGCSKWKWCINSFYMKLNLAQLQYFSFNILVDEISDVHLKLAPLCINNSKTIFEYLLRTTMSVRSHIYVDNTY